MTKIDEVYVIPKYFILPFWLTCHSLQGSTVYDVVVILGNNVTKDITCQC